VTISANMCTSSGNILVDNATHVTMTDNTCIAASGYADNIKVRWSSQINVRGNTCSNGESGIEIENSSDACIETNYCFNNINGIYTYNSTSVIVKSNTLIYNNLGLVFFNSDVEQQDNVILDKKEIFLMIALAIIIAVLITAILAFLAWDKKHNKVPLEREVRLLETAATSLKMDNNTPKRMADITGVEQSKLDFRVSWMIFKINTKNLFIAGLVGLIVYGAIRLLLLCIENIIVNLDGYRFLQYARLHDVALFFVDMFLIAFFLSPQHVLAHQTMGTGEIVSNIKKITLKFWRSGIGFAFIILLAGTSLFALQINGWTDSTSESWYLPTHVIGYVLHFGLMVIFTGMFPIYSDTGKFVQSLKLQLKMFKAFRKRFIRTWGWFFVIFVVPNAIISIIVASILNVSFTTSIFPLISILSIVSFTLFGINIIIGLPLMAFIAARIYHGLKNCIVNGQVTAVGDGKGGSEASTTSGEHKGE
jgi:parallel beta-helix repeat protein